MERKRPYPALIRLGLLITSTIYALVLTHPKGKEWADRQTWSTVVLGVGFTLGWMALEDEKAASKARDFFMWSAGPIIIRSLALQLDEIRYVIYGGSDATET